MTPAGRARSAERLAAGRIRLAAMDAPPRELRPADVAEAYAVQRLLHERYREAGLGDVAGYKIGCTSRVMQRYLGIDHPCAGGVLAPTVHAAGADLPCAGYCRVGVECELAVRLCADLPPRALPFTAGEVAPAVGQVMAAIEIVDDRWRDFTRVDTPSLIADDFFGAGCVLGDAVAFDPAMDLRALRGHMSVNGDTAGQGTGADILGHPLEALAWLAVSGAPEGGLRAGQVVLLGSMVKTRWLAPGDGVQVTVDGLGSVAARFS